MRPRQDAVCMWSRRAAPTERMKYVTVPFPVSDEMLAEHRTQASLSARHRFLYLICGGPNQPTQAFLNTFLKDSQVRPHRHIMDETIEIIDGTFRVSTFNDDGTIKEEREMQSGDVFVLPANVWHTSECLTEHGTFLGIKEGFYSPDDDKEFAPWATV